ncbi:hypothetical protein IFM89_038043 [Coptis chinensis]|uniref:PCI domain-containing protein n=1 Tax=Coptis chinensis TaxID=261450 RepID=A0A835H321_9MAGN|nr:hypothetical protein IFM89_038043 [Coptis chinensis]
MAVRVGDLELFRNVADKFASTFNSDRTHNLIVRLRHNVIRTGLRNISISYSRISLKDVAEKLRLNSENPVADAGSIVAKAIRDGAIDATIDHANGLICGEDALFPWINYYGGITLLLFLCWSNIVVELTDVECIFQAVRVGDLELFRNVADKFASTFNSDRTHNLIVRLRHNVIRTGLRNISISYSRISLKDVAEKLRLNSENPVADAGSIVAKAIRDGAIDATIDHANG